MANLDVTFLGTSAANCAFRNKQRFSLPSLLTGMEALLDFDAGEGMQYNFIRGRFGFNKKTRIFITHMHSDHIWDSWVSFRHFHYRGAICP